MNFVPTIVEQTGRGERAAVPRRSGSGGAHPSGQRAAGHVRRVRRWADVGRHRAAVAGHRGDVGRNDMSTLDRLREILTAYFGV